MKLKQYFLVFFSIAILCNDGLGQIDTANTSQDTTFRVNINELTFQGTKKAPASKLWIKRNPYKALIIPAGLIGVGAALIKNPVYDRYDFFDDLEDIKGNFKGSKIDDYLIYSPYVMLVGLNIAKVRCENDLINTALIITKAEIINIALTFSLKKLTSIERPNGTGEFNSWPSGHTSEAFLAATIVNREFRYKSKWIGRTAYALAGTVGLFRMLNERHWLSDVVAGAGIGILSANITYLTHQWRFGRPGTCFIPMYNNGHAGFAFVHQF